MAYLPRWSPDGKQIALQGYSPDKPWATYLMSADGGNLEELMPGDTNVGWSADGKWLVVGTYSPFSDLTGSGPKEIRLMNLKTHKTTTLAGSEGLYSPRWSPDGRYIAAFRSGPETLWLYDVSSQKWSGELEKIPVGYPSWSHDSKYVYFDSPGQSAPGFYRVGISSHKLEMLASLKDFKGFSGWSGLTPDDSPLLLRNIGTQEIYALDWDAP